MDANAETDALTVAQIAWEEDGGEVLKALGPRLRTVSRQKLVEAVFKVGYALAVRELMAGEENAVRPGAGKNYPAPFCSTN